MKKYFYILLFFLLNTVLCAQSPALTGVETTQAVGRVAGELMVTPTGAATYIVPIAVPPGIREVAPSIALTYNSQGGDGIAGWGWNLTGLSTISRVGATLHHDGVIDPVDFDALDRFALDGQRLLLKNTNDTYGADQTEYQTENYSNIKIIAQGSTPINGTNAPLYFVVYYPDGSRAWYGQGNSLGQLEWAISRWEDPQGNRIDYDYTSNGGVLQIHEITYGAKTKNTHQNHIIFKYSNRKKAETTYVDGIKFYRSTILNEIQAFNNDKVFRTYQINHNHTEIGYNRIKTIVEFNSEGASKPPVEFSYPDDATSMEYKKHPFTDGVNDDLIFDPEKQKLISGDFDGDGTVDFITYNKNNISNFSFHIRNQGGGIDGINVKNSGRTGDLVPSSFETIEGQISEKQGVVFINEEIIKNKGSIPQVDYYYSKMTFRNYNLNMNNSDNVEYYEKSWTNYNVTNFEECGVLKGTLVPKYKFSGDFNGDGKSEILLIEKNYKFPVTNIGSDGNCYHYNVTSSSNRAYLVNMDRNVSENFVSYLGNLDLVIKDEDKLMVSDFNGDGKSDIISISNGIIEVFSLNDSEQIKKIFSKEIPELDIKKPLLFGDYNGDGKLDFMFPEKRYYANWYLFLFTGKDFEKIFKKNIGIQYWEPKGEQILNSNWDREYYNNELQTYQEYRYISQDVNLDGKTDIVEHYKYISKEKNNLGKHAIFNGISFHQNIIDLFLPSSNKNSDENKYKRYNFVNRDEIINNPMYGYPLELQNDSRTFTTKYTYVLGQNIFTFDFDFNHTESILIAEINRKQKGLIQTINYNILSSLSNNAVYLKGNTQIYPYINVNTALNFPLVQKVTTQSSRLSTIEQFRYYGAVSHAQGLGFLGFMGVARTNAYGKNTAALWNLSLHDPKLRGAITQSWSTKNNPFYSQGSKFTPPSKDFIQKTTYQYLSPTAQPNGRFVAPVDNIKTEDGLNGFTTYQSFLYDSYYNPTEILTERSQGKTKKTMTYDNKPGATTADYYIGRLTQETTTETWQDKSHTSTQQYSYKNNLLDQIETQGEDTPTLTENYVYDTFGNLISKKRSAPNLEARTESFAYTSDGRFLASSTDIAGLTTQFEYNDDGSLESQTDPFGNTTTYTYDGWQRPSSITDYLDNVSRISYRWLGNLVVSHNKGADGSQHLSITDAWGREVAQGSLGLDNKWSWVNRHYDAAGRVF